MHPGCGARPDPNSADYYKVLGVNREASAPEIAKARAAAGLIVFRDVHLYIEVFLMMCTYIEMFLMT